MPRPGQRLDVHSIEREDLDTQSSGVEVVDAQGAGCIGRRAGDRHPGEHRERGPQQPAHVSFPGGRERVVARSSPPCVASWSWGGGPCPWSWLCPCPCPCPWPSGSCATP